MKETGTDSASRGEGDSIKVFLRVRPPENTGVALPCSGRVVEVNTSGNSVTLLAKPEPKMFTFDHVADINSTQESVFSAVGKSLIESCVAGYNGTIFAYGQTGSGKTFTMLGPSEDCDNFKHELRGVIPRSFEHLFNLISREHELHGERKQFLCKCSFLEIYQEQVYDLLDPAAANLQLRENIKKGVFVDGLMEHVVATPSEAYQALSTGWLNRRVAATSMNRESSRSHAVFTLTIESKEEKNGVKNVRESQLNLVDLAGSERQKDTNTVGIRLKEAGKINQSLSVLGNVIMSLVKITQGRPQHIPYRDSKLTFLLRDSLGGNARTSIVACVHPDAKCFGETLSTLNFAKRAKQIKNKAVINEDTQGNVAHLQMEIRRLRDMLTQLQNGSVPHPLPSHTASEEGDHGNAVLQGTEAYEWKNKFMEAMLFRQKSEQEKEGLQSLLGGAEEACKKKDRIIQSSRLIIKLRESTIAALEKKAKAAGDMTDKNDNQAKLQEEVVSLKARLDQYPQVDRLDQQLHSLRAQLNEARIRLDNTTATLLDSNRLHELEQAFCDLQAASRRESAVASPRSVSADSHTSASLQKLKEKVEVLEEENQQLRKQMTEEQQGWESKEAKLQAELTATKKMNSDLERLLEANHLKHRIQNDALNNLHCQTIKALTPTRNVYDLRNRTVVCQPDLNLDQSIEMETGEEGICNEAPPAAMVENAHEALREEIQALQQENSSLQERINEYEADMVRVRQQVNQLELEKDSVTQLLEKERTHGAEKREEGEKNLRELKSLVDTLTAEVKYAKEESQDYKLLLQSSDRELRAEKDKVKAYNSSTDQKVNMLETQLLQVHSEVESLGRQLEEETKEREGMEEKLEMERMEKVFLEEQLHTLETALCSKTQECHTSQAKLQELELRLVEEKEEQQRLRERSHEFGKLQEEQLEEASHLRQRVGDLTKDCEEKRSQLDAMATELETTKTTVTELQRDVADNREALQQQVQRVQELKGKLQETEDRCSVLQDLADSRSAEVADAKQQCDNLLSDVQAKNDEIAAAAMDRDMLNEDLAFYQEQNEKAVQECEALRQSVETLEAEKETLQQMVQSLKTEAGEKEGRLQQISQALEEMKARSPAASPDRPATSPERPLEHSTIHENKLAAMVEELTKGRELWMEENQQLKRQIVEMTAAATENKGLTQKCQDLQLQLDNQNETFKESIRQIKELYEAEQTDGRLTRESLAETQRQLEASTHDKELLLSQCEEAQAERKHAEEELDRLKAVVEKSYMERDQLTSQMEEIKEQFTKMKGEVTAAETRAQELAADNAVLAGHANHTQKVQYVKKMQTDYNDLKEKYDQLAKDHQALRLRLPLSPLKDRTNIAAAAPLVEHQEKAQQHI